MINMASNEVMAAKIKQIEDTIAKDAKKLEKRARREERKQKDRERMRRGNKELVDDLQKIEKTQASVSTKSVNFKSNPLDVLMDDDKTETGDDISDTDSQESTYGNSQDALISNRKRKRRINDEVVELFESVEMFLAPIL